MKKINVVGLGYIGLPTALSLAVNGNNVVGTDYNKTIVDSLISGECEFTENGIPAEDARFILPNACATSMVVSLNLREFIHVANIRLCTRAQDEIRLLVKKMCQELIKDEPWLKPYLVPKCERMGYCDESKSCGRKPSLESLKGIH